MRSLIPKLRALQRSQEPGKLFLLTLEKIGTRRCAFTSWDKYARSWSDRRSRCRPSPLSARTESGARRAVTGSAAARTCSRRAGAGSTSRRQTELPTNGRECLPNPSLKRLLFRRRRPRSPRAARPPVAAARHLRGCPARCWSVPSSRITADVWPGNSDPPAKACPSYHLDRHRLGLGDRRWLQPLDLGQQSLELLLIQTTQPTRDRAPRFRSLLSRSRKPRFRAAAPTTHSACCHLSAASRTECSRLV